MFFFLFCDGFRIFDISKNIHFNKCLPFQNSNSKDVGALQKRQSDVIKQLEQLRLKLNEMQAKLGVSNVPVQSKPSAPIIKPIDVIRIQMFDFSKKIIKFRFLLNTGKISTGYCNPCKSSKYSIFTIGLAKIMGESVKLCDRVLYTF